MKCLIDARFDRTLGGTSVYSRSLIQAILKLAPDVDFYLLVNREDDYERQENVKGVFVYGTFIQDLSRYLSSVLRASYVVNKLAKKIQPDVIFCPAQIKLPLISKWPVATVIYDLQHFYYPEFFSLAEHLRRRLFIGNSIRYSKWLFTISSFSAESIKKKYGRSTKVIYAGADYFSQTPIIDNEFCNSVLSKYNISEPFLFYPANNWKHKNHRTLLNALSILKINGKLNFQTIFTGTVYPDSYDIVNEARCLGLEKVSHIGYVNFQELRALYQKADIVAFPSLLEGFGMPILEAMASGTPVIASNAASIPEVAGEAAMLIESQSSCIWADAIEKLMKDDALKQKMRDAGFINAKRFSWENSARLVLEEIKRYQFTRNKDAFSVVG